MWTLSQSELRSISARFKIDLSWIDLRSISVRFEKVFTRFGLRSISDRSNSLVWIAPKILDSLKFSNTRLNWDLFYSGFFLLCINAKLIRNVLFRIHSFVCKRQNESGTKTFRNPDSFRSRVNEVSKCEIYFKRNLILTNFVVKFILKWYDNIQTSF